MTSQITSINSNNFRKSLEFTLKWEGGLSNHLADQGGLTNFGITQTSYSTWKGRKFDCVSKISKQEAEQFYFEECWLKAECDRIILPLAIVHFDTTVNFGLWGSIQFLAESLNISTTQDNLKNLVFGKLSDIKTVSDFQKIALKYCQGRIQYRHQRVQEKPDQEVFLEGWLNRDNDLLELVSNLNTTLSLRIIKPTVIKLKPIQSTELSDFEKVQVSSPRVFSINCYERIRKHVRVYVNDEDEPFKGKPIWYIFEEHCQVYETPDDLISGSDLIIPKSKKKVQLNVSYKSQTDNFYNSTGACNVTSVAMCLEYFKAKRNPQYSRFTQFEDELYQYCLDRGYSRQNPYHLAQVIRDYGCQDKFTEYALIEQVKDWIAEDNPCIIHGYFTSFGHIIVAVGYDEDGLIVHDPYGEWFSTGYRTDLTGAYLHYSYGLIKKTCIPDGKFWVHFVSK